MSEETRSIVEALRLVADGREEYAQSGGPTDWREFQLGQAAAYRTAADLIEGRDVRDFIANGAPSWRWPKDVHEWVMRDVPK